MLAEPGRGVEREIAISSYSNVTLSLSSPMWCISEITAFLRRIV